MTPELEPLEPFASSLLHQERQVGPIVDVEARSRVLQRLEQPLILSPAGAASKGALLTVTHSLPFGLAMLATGALLGAGATMFLRPATVVTVEVPVVVHEAPPVVQTPEPAVAQTEPVKQPTASLKVTRPALAPTPVAGEQALLETVRSALLSRRFDEALTSLERYQREFPTGAMTEEHDALEVQALSLGSHPEQARARAERFRQRYPNSIFLPAVNAVSPR